MKHTKKVHHKVTTATLKPFDWNSMNFIVFLTLALILMVAVVSQLSTIKFTARSKASNSCPTITQLPRPEDCPGGEWKFKRDFTGCEVFSCEVK